MIKKILIIAGFLAVSSMAHAQACIWTDDPQGPACNVIPQRSGLTLGSPTRPWGNIYGTVTGTSATYTGAVTADEFLLTDGSDKNYQLNVYGAGTAYSLTNTAAALDFGTTDPVKVINKAGTYLLLARVNLEYVGATFAANRTVTLKLRRTNNTAADVTNSSTTLGTNIVTTIDGVLGVVNLPPVIYTTTATTDSLTIFGDVSVVPTAGALNATEASIVAIRLF